VKTQTATSILIAGNVGWQTLIKALASIANIQIEAVWLCWPTVKFKHWPQCRQAYCVEMRCTNLVNRLCTCMCTVAKSGQLLRKKSKTTEIFWKFFCRRWPLFATTHDTTEVTTKSYFCCVVVSQQRTTQQHHIYAVLWVSFCKKRCYICATVLCVFFVSVAHRKCNGRWSIHACRGGKRYRIAYVAQP